MCADVGVEIGWAERLAVVGKVKLVVVMCECAYVKVGVKMNVKVVIEGGYVELGG